MAKIKPFKAIIYNQEKVRDISKVICPPYDIISSQKQQYYHDISPYNLIRILLGKDIPGEDKYKNAAGYFKDWLKDKIFIQDEKPAIYFHSQQYNLKGERKVRQGFIGLLSLDSSIFGHEHTRLEPKEDRLKLLKKVKANLSPIFVLFSDHKRIIPRTQQHIQDIKPFIDIVDEEKVSHKLWRLDSEEILNRFQDQMKRENIFIADGHHRYEVACLYRDEMKRRLGTVTLEEDFNYIMAYFTNLESHGLTILPIHRLVKLDAKMSVISNLKIALSEYFYVEEVKDRIKFFFLLEKAGYTEHVIGMYKERNYWLLRLKNVKILDKIITDKPSDYKSLDISILNYIILEKILGLDLADKERLTFSHNSSELIGATDSDSSCIAFFLNPVKSEQITSLALKGQKLPAKTTYFYPKVLSGLVINKFNV